MYFITLRKNIENNTDTGSEIVQVFFRQEVSFRVFYFIKVKTWVK